MNEVKTTLRRMALYYLLVAGSIFLTANVIPDRFPLRTVSEIYLLLLSLCLVLYYAHRVSPTGSLSVMMKLLSWMALLLILLRGVKYSAFSEVDALARHTWYLYYLPMLLFPLFLLGISLLVSAREGAHVPKLWYGTLALTAVLIALVLTNDLHQQVFRFQPGFQNWDHEYSRGWLFYAVFVWQYALYLAASVILVIKCRVGSAKKNAWIILIPFAIGTAMNLLLIIGKMPKINGTHVMEFPETMVLMVTAALECCIQLGLIPTNTDYGRLFQQFSICAQITDQKGKPVYASHSAIPLTPEQFALPDNSRIGEHRVLRKMEIPGGYGFWQDDLTELDRLNAELAEAKAALAQEAELTRLNNELKKRQTQIEQRTLVYDTIAERTQRQSQRISRLAKAARASQDAARKEFCRRRITLLGAYIKRYANLMLLSQQSRVIEVGELGLSISELLRYLNFCGVPGELVRSADCAVPAEAAIAAFESFEALLERNDASLQGVFVNLSAGASGVTVKMTFENLTETLPDDEAKRLSGSGVSCELQREDDVTYVCLTLPRGGGAA